MVTEWEFYHMLVILLLIYPSIWGLNEMLNFSIFHKCIIFNNKKTTCIKFGDIIKTGEKLF